MNIDNSISFERVKKALPIKTVLSVLLIVSVLSTLFYITLQNRDRDEMFIWFVTTDMENCFSDEALESINDYGEENGLDRILITRKHPEDQYFDVLMSTSAYYTCDIFIMREELVRKYSEMGMFMPVIGERQDENLIYFGEDPVGILLYEDYYLLINAETKYDTKVIYDIIDILIENKKGK